MRPPFPLMLSFLPLFLPFFLPLPLLLLLFFLLPLPLLLLLHFCCHSRRESAVLFSLHNCYPATNGSGHGAYARTISSEALAHVLALVLAFAVAFAVAFLLSFPQGICCSLQPSQLLPRDHREQPRRARATAACNADHRERPRRARAAAPRSGAAAACNAVLLRCS